MTFNNPEFPGFENKEAFTARALIADDEVDIRSVLVEHLQLRGFKVDVVPTAQLAIYASAQHDYDIFVLDVSTGTDGINGIYAAKTIHENPKYKGKPIIFLSSSNVGKEAKSEGAAYFVKPASLLEVADKAKHMVQMDRIKGRA